MKLQILNIRLVMVLANPLLESFKANNFYKTEIKIWAVFGLLAIVQKKIGFIMSNF